MHDDGCILSIRYPLVECVFLPQRLLQARARQKGWTNVRIFGSVESWGMSHVGTHSDVIVLAGVFLKRNIYWW